MKNPFSLCRRASRLPRAAFLLAAWLIGANSVCIAQQPDAEIAVKVQKNGSTVVVDVDFIAPVSQQDAWNVLTDFDHMGRFISNLQSSKITGRDGNKLQVSQKGHAARAGLSFPFESVREVELTPREKIQTRLINGSMKKLDGTTSLSADAGGTRIVYHGESVPDVWIPPVVGVKFIEDEIREQYQEMRDEMLKRKAGGTVPVGDKK